MKSYDVYSYGVVTASTLYSIRDAFPAAEGYGEILSVRHMVGGEATNSSIVLSRLGVGVKLDGSWLGADNSGRRTKTTLSEYEIDTTRLPLINGHETVQEVVFAADNTRTIFATYGRLLQQAAWNMPLEYDIKQAKVISLDPFFKEPAVRVAEVATAAGIPIVTVDCRHDDPLLGGVSAVIVAESFIRENYPDGDVEALFRQYQAAANGLVVFTFGAAGIWYADPGESLKRRDASVVQAVDTSGGGDAFRAGIVYGYLNDWETHEMIEFAAAVAALVCATSPGVLNAPTITEVVEFLKLEQS